MNCIIYEKGKEEISHFILNCVKRGNNFHGDNGRFMGIKPSLFDHKWIEDVINPVLDKEGVQIGWDKKVSEVGSTQRQKASWDEEGDELPSKPSREEKQKFLKMIEPISNLTPNQIDLHIENVFGNLNPNQKISLKRLYKTVMILTRLLD